MTYQAAFSADSDYELHHISETPGRHSHDEYFSHVAPAAASTVHLRPVEQGYGLVDNSSRQGPHSEVIYATATLPGTRQANWSVWRWEIVSCITSVACTVTLAAVLIRFNGRTLPSWPLGITLNALISVLGVFSKAATLVVIASCIGQLKWHWFTTARSLRDFETFDEASRGPVGSIALLFQTRSWNLAALGASLTILAVAVDPFVQQIVGYEQRAVWVPRDTHAFRAQAYDAGVEDRLGGGVQVGPEFGMKAAIYTGLFVGPDMTDPTPKCDTGNCTFSPFTSLAVCSQCANVTDQTTKVSTTDDGPLRDGVGDITYNITYALPGSVLMNITYTDYVTGSGDVSVNYGSAMSSRTGHNNDMSRDVLNVSSPITAISLLQFPTVNAEGYQGNFSQATPLAWECALYFCVNTYAVNVTSGVPSTQLLSSWHDIDASPISRTDSDENTYLHLPPSLLPDAHLLGPNKSTVSQNNSFSIDTITLLTLSDWLNFTLSGDMQLEIELVPSGTYVNDIFSVLNSTANLTSLFANLSTSMTNYIRSGVPLDPTFSYAEGSAYLIQTFIHVRWPWMILLVAIVLLSAIFLAATVAVSTEDRVWKASSLAMMFLGVEGGGEDLKEMRGAAEHRRVVLGRDAQGRWKLVPAGDEGLNHNFHAQGTIR